MEWFSRVAARLASSARARASRPAAISQLYSAACSRMAWPPSASSWLTSPSGASLPSALAITCCAISGDHTGRMSSAAINMSRPK